MANELERLRDRVRTHTGEYIEIALRDAYRIGLGDNVTEGTFEWAMQQMRQGKAVKRESFSFKMLMPPGSQVTSAGARGIDLEHLAATDWEIVPEPKPEPEGHDFKWAAEQIKSGKRVQRKAWGMWPWSIGGKNGSVNISDACECDWILAPEGESK